MLLQQRRHMKPCVDNGGDAWVHALPLFQQSSNLDFVDPRHAKHLGRSIRKLKLFFWQIAKMLWNLGQNAHCCVYFFLTIWILLIWIHVCLWFEMIFMNIGWTWILWEFILNDWNYFVRGVLNLLNIGFGFVFYVIEYGPINF
jgi:hypothetical protein